MDSSSFLPPVHKDRPIIDPDRISKIPPKSLGIHSFTCLIETEKHAALVYELQLKEVFHKYKAVPSSERTSICFNILNEILPQLGPYRNLINLIRDELFQSIYSPMDYTSGKYNGAVEHMPFFGIINKLDRIR